MTTRWSLSQDFRSCSRSHVRSAKCAPETCPGVRAAGPRGRALRSQSPCFSRVASVASSASAGDDAPRADRGLFRTEGARRTSHKRLRAQETAKREGRCVITQAIPFQYAEEVARGESRAAAVISESIGIPSHLSLPPFDARQ
jgi:hypothetical protein